MPQPNQCLNPRRRTKSLRRTLTLRPEEQYRALPASREYQRTAAFVALYGLSAGIEGTYSQTVRGARRSRYVAQPKTHLGHVLTAVAINPGASTPGSPTRLAPDHSSCARLMAAAT